MSSAFDLRVGVLGGGQLGRMLVPTALRWNLALSFLDPDPAAPCGTCGLPFTVGDLLDHDTVVRFGETQDVVTIEIEHVNAAALRTLSARGVLVRPSADIVALVQDKGAQKEFYTAHGFPTAEYVLVENAREIPAHRNLFPIVQKLRRSGYDGRGVQKLTDPDQIASAFDAPSVLERLVPLQREISVIVSRDAAGREALYPPVEMEFHPEANLVELLFCPAEIDATLSARAGDLARRLARELKLEGILAVEMFVTPDDELLINEIAPRPHNSGHHTIEACVTSQFEQHLRAILNLPPGDTRLTRAAAGMINVLGAEGHSGPAHYDAAALAEAFALPDVHLHLYGKSITRPFRKMGHITVAGESPAAVRELARRLQGRVRSVTN